MATQAQRGGEYGKNGEWYDGGQFLPANAYTIKGEVKVTRRDWQPRKCEVAPYTWEMQPTETARTIWTLAGAALVYNRYTKMMSVNPNYRSCNPNADNNQGWLGYSYAELAEMWNNGQRWIEPC
jgi:hypothetical protein